MNDFIKLGRLVFIRDIFKYFSIILICYSVGNYTISYILKSLDDIKIFKLKIIIITGLISFILYKILKNKCLKLCEKISKNK
jgi:hypothetical protein